MNPLVGIGIVAAIIYQIIVDGTYLKIYIICIAAYYILT
jgi:hypothetical protein